MEKFKNLLVLLGLTISLVSCEKVDSGYQGVGISWGGQTDMSTTYNEGLHWGLHWLWDDMETYDVKEQTMVQSYEFNDKNNMVTRVELSLDYNLNPRMINHLHKEVSDVYSKINKTLKSAGQEVVPHYSTIELNITKGKEVEDKIAEIVKKELPKFYVEFVRLQMTDVDIPKKLADLAEETAVQLGRNELAKAKVAKAKIEFEKAQYEAKTKAILSKR